MIIVRKIQIPGLETAKPRRLYIYLPKDYEVSDRRYPVLYMFDGHNVFYNSHATYGKSWGMKEYLQKTKLPLIVVGIESNREGKRLSEYSPWDFSRRAGHDGLDRKDPEILGRRGVPDAPGPRTYHDRGQFHGRAHYRLCRSCLQ